MSDVDGVSRSEQAIVLRELEKSWRGPSGPIRAVRGIDLSIERGETVALLGPNGAGKSTTIDMILGLARPDAGSVSVLGRSPGDAVAAGLIGAMLQTGELIRNLSVRELIAMTGSLYPKPMDVDAVLELTGLARVAQQRTQKLSGGQIQRARFAVALVGDPALLVLDEPTVAMDVEARRAFWHAMRELASEGRTVLFATHYLEEADANADRAVLLAAGSVVADGPTTEIKGRVGTRTIRATLAGRADRGARGAARASRAPTATGTSIRLVCGDSDAAIRALLDRHADARDIEVAGAGLEDAFIHLTGGAGGGMTSLVYTRYELLRTFRERRLFIFSFGFPLILYFVIVAPNRNVRNIDGTGISFALYYMAGLASFGTMMSMMSSGFRIAGERQAGWTRQLRITPLSPRAYLRAKVITGVRDGRAQPRAALHRGGVDGGQPRRRHLAEDDRADRDRAAAVRGARDRARAPADRRLDRARDRRARVAARDRQRHLVPGHRLPARRRPVRAVLLARAGGADLDPRSRLDRARLGGRARLDRRS